MFVRLDATGEVMVKRENDPWIVAKRSDMQELIVTINQKNANLKEIRGRKLFELNTKKKQDQFILYYLDRVKQLFTVQFNNILLLK